MYERYHIPIKTVQGRAQPVPKFVIVRADNCINCSKCERACIYEVHKRSAQDPRKMADPASHLCKNCFMCIQECPQRSLTMAPGAEYRSLGRGVWTPLRISTIWGEAETGKIPVLGAGYRGMFAGSGYDGMWTDMSEIVRPTRDGIHGREFISTSVDVGRKPAYLEFDAQGRIVTEMAPLVELPIPLVMDVTRLRSTSRNMLTGFARAARVLKTLLIAPEGYLPEDASTELNSHFVPVFPEGADVLKIRMPKGVRMAELQMTSAWQGDANLFRSRFPDIVLSFRMNASKETHRILLDMVRSKIDVAHVVYDEESVEQEASDAVHAKESLRGIHKALVSEAVRDQITVIAGGGIAAAEHVPKSIICGADVVAIEKALVIALECRDCITCSEGSCPVNLRNAPAEWVEGRATNMVGAWRDQLLEVLGAMGLREVRRLRGELGRAIFFEDVEREAFGGIEGGAP